MMFQNFLLTRFLICQIDRYDQSQLPKVCRSKFGSIDFQFKPISFLLDIHAIAGQLIVHELHFDIIVFIIVNHFWRSIIKIIRLN